MRLAPLVLVIAVGMTSPAAAGQTTRLITDFTEADSAGSWQTVNDGVMGGLSRGDFSIPGDGGRLVFAGETSLRNNGGFSSIRMNAGKLALSDYEGIVIRVKGDGRAYKLSLRTGARTRGWRIAYWAEFDAPAGEWTDVRVPFSSFKPTSFGYELEGPALDLTDIRSVGFMLYDKKAGEFRLEVDRIAAYGHAPNARLTKGQKSERPEKNTIVDVASAAGSFKTLLAAVGAAGLESVLRSEGPFTVLAPTDEAFAKLPEGTVATLLRPENRPKLEAVLKNHVFAGRIDAAAAIGAGRGETLAKETLTFGIVEGRLRIGSATVLKNDIAADNGIIHVIDSVLVPAKLPDSLPVDRIPLLLEHAIERGVTLFNAGNAEGCWLRLRGHAHESARLR